MPRPRVLAVLAFSLCSAVAQGRGVPPRDPNILRYPPLTPEIRPAHAVTLLFSDSPERPRESGLLYRDTLTGQARVLAYHENGLGRDARLLVLARNPGHAPLVLTTEKRGSALTPNPDPVIGQQTLLRYFASAPLAPRTVEAGAQVTLFDFGVLKANVVASVMLDLSASAPVELSVVLLGENERRAGANVQTLPALPRDANHQRGTFPGANRALKVALGELPARLVLGGGSDVPLRGTDVLSGAPQVLLGNFGVLYDLEFTDARRGVLALSARGGRYRGAARVTDGARSSLVLLGAGRTLLDPAAPAFVWRARAESLRLRFVPANGSNLPVAFVLYPVGREP